MTTVTTEIVTNNSAHKCSTGNTTAVEQTSGPKKINKRVRFFPNFTSFLEEEPFYDETRIKYLIYGKETCPTTGKNHWQGAVYFFDKVSIKFAQSILKIGNSHMETITKGDELSAIMYCKKEGNYKEFGTPPHQGHRKDLESIKNEILSNKLKVKDIIISNPIMYHQYGRTLEKIENINMRKKFRTTMTKGFWYYGETGTGKSEKAFENYTPETHYVHNLNGDWWDRYEQQKICIFDEFRGQIKFDEMLSLCDKHPKFVKVKGKEDIPFTSEIIIVTSSLHPEEIYKNSLSKNDKMKQFYRRFEIIELKKSS